MRQSALEQVGAGSILRQVTLIVAIFAVLFGLAFGSFLNVCISRLPRHLSIVRPASHCPDCNVPVRGSDNIPLLSWVLLRGRCRNCGWSIPWRYPLVELAGGVLFLLIFLRFGLTLQGAGMAVFCLLLLGLAGMDAETFLLPDALTLPGIGLGVLFSGIAAGWKAAGVNLLAALGAAALLLLIRGVYWLIRKREGMGMGDVKLMAMMAAWLGPWLALLTLFLGVIFAAISGLMMMARHRRGAGQTRLPFGSFLCAAALYAVFYGEQTIKWYMQFFR